MEGPIIQEMEGELTGRERAFVNKVRKVKSKEKLESLRFSADSCLRVFHPFCRNLRKALRMLAVPLSSLFTFKTLKSVSNGVS